MLALRKNTRIRRLSMTVGLLILVIGIATLFTLYMKSRTKPPEPPTHDSISINTPSPSPAVQAPASTHLDPSQINVIVNKKHPIEPRDFTPKVADTKCAQSGSATISTLAITDFQALCTAASRAGVPLDTSSSYRSYSYQVSTYNHWVSISGQAEADTYSARPGYSEHQTGFAVDFSVPGGASLSDFTGSPQQKWLAANAWKYGWIQRYTEANQAKTGYESESWHYRYIGRKYSAQYTKYYTSSLETFWNISGGDY